MVKRNVIEFDAPTVWRKGSFDLNQDAVVLKKSSANEIMLDPSNWFANADNLKPFLIYLSSNHAQGLSDLISFILMFKVDMEANLIDTEKFMDLVNRFEKLIKSQYAQYSGESEIISIKNEIQTGASFNESMFLQIQKFVFKLAIDKYYQPFIESSAIPLDHECWLEYLSDLLENAKSMVEDTSKLIGCSDEQRVITLLQTKVDAQRQIEEFLEIISAAQESPFVEPRYPINEASVTAVLYSPAETQNHLLDGIGMAMNFLNSASQAQYNLSIHCKNGSTWSILKRIKDIEDLYHIVKVKYPRTCTFLPKALTKVANRFSSFEKAHNIDDGEELELWLTSMLCDPVCAVYDPVVYFFQPASEVKRTTAPSPSLFPSASEIELSVQKAFTSAGSAFKQVSGPAADILSTSVNQQLEESGEQIKFESSLLSQEDMDVILDVAFSAFEELFSIGHEQWMRQQSLNLIKVVLKKTFGNKLSKLIASKLESASSQSSLAMSLTSVAEALWPDGRKWGSGPVTEPKSEHEIARVKHQLFCVLTEQEGMTKRKELKSAVNGIQNLVGTKNTRLGLLRGFHLVQNQELNAGLCSEIIEVIVDMLTVV